MISKKIKLIKDCPDSFFLHFIPKVFLSFSAIFTKADNFSDFLLASLGNSTLQKGSIFKEKNWLLGKQILFYES